MAEEEAKKTEAKQQQKTKWNVIHYRKTNDSKHWEADPPKTRRSVSTSEDKFPSASLVGSSANTDQEKKLEDIKEEDEGLGKEEGERAARRKAEQERQQQEAEEEARKSTKKNNMTDTDNNKHVKGRQEQRTGTVKARRGEHENKQEQ